MHFVQNRKENCHHDHIPFNVKGIGNIVFSVRSDKKPHTEMNFCYKKTTWLTIANEENVSFTEAFWEYHPNTCGTKSIYKDFNQ